jgi:hypothetical protein
MVGEANFNHTKIQSFLFTAFGNSLFPQDGVMLRFISYCNFGCSEVSNSSEQMDSSSVTPLFLPCPLAFFVCEYRCNYLVLH